MVFQLRLEYKTLGKQFKPKKPKVMRFSMDRNIPNRCYILHQQRTNAVPYLQIQY